MHAAAHEHDDPLGELTGLLRAAVAQVRELPLPAGLSASVLERAAGWSPSSPAVAQRAWHGSLLVYVAAAAVLLAIGIVAAVRWNDQQREGQPIAVPNAQDNAADGTDGAERGGQAAGQRGLGPRPKAPPATGDKPATPSGVPVKPPPVFGGARAAGLSPSRSAALAADATVLVSTGGDKPITLGQREPWTATSKLHVWDWSKSPDSKPLDAEAGGFAVSPDGKYAVTNHGKRIDLATGKVEDQPGCDGKLDRLVFSPDGKRLAVIVRGGDGPPTPNTCRVIDFPAGKKLCEIDNVWPAMWPLTFSPDGGQIFVMDKSNVVHRYDAATGKQQMAYEPKHENSLRTMLVSPDGKLLASGGSRGDILLWDIASGKLLHTLKAQPDVFAPHGVESFAFSTDGKRLAGGAVQNANIWNLETGEVELILPNASGGAIQLRFSKDGKKLTTVRGFYGASNPATGDDLLVYPELQEWDLEKDGKKLKPTK